MDAIMLDELEESVTFICTLEKSVQVQLNKCCEILRLLVSSNGVIGMLPHMRRLLLSCAGSDTLNETIQHLVLVDRCALLLGVPEVWISFVEQQPVNQEWAVNLLHASEGCHGDASLISESVGHRGMHHLFAAAVNAVGVHIRKRVASIAVVMLAAGPHQVFELALVQQAKGYLVAYMQDEVCCLDMPQRFAERRLAPLQALQSHGADITPYDLMIVAGAVGKLVRYDASPQDLFVSACQIAQDMQGVTADDLHASFELLVAALPRLYPRLPSGGIESLRQRLLPLTCCAELVDALSGLLLYRTD